MTASVQFGEPPEQTFDNVLFARLHRDYTSGLLSVPMRTRLQYATRADIGTSWPSKEHRELGRSLIGSGEVGAVVLCGGLATRFGGQAKAAVELSPGWTLLRIKLEALSTVAEAHDTTLAVVVVVSFATELAVREILEQHAYPRLRVEVARQSVLPRIQEDGRLLLQQDGSLNFSPPGHGEVLKLLAARNDENGTAARIWQISNIDNLLASLDPDIVGAHASSQADATVEVAPGRPTDVGGYVACGRDGFEIIEGFQVEVSERPSGEFFFSTNTFLVGNTAIAAGERLPFYAVKKTTPEGQAAIQFEQLLGDVGRVVSLNAVAVPRDGDQSRFRPIKLVEDLDEAREALISTLEASGLIRW